MKKKTLKTYAVLTGDLIAYSALKEGLRESVGQYLKQRADDFAGRYPKSVFGRLDVFRGDSWQLCLNEPSLAVQAAVFMRVGLKAHPSRENIDSRIGIGIGGIDHLSATRISESGGPAFVRSGTALDSLSGKLWLKLDWPDGPEATALLNAVALPLLDIEINRWTYAESVAIYGSLMGWTQQETADHPLARKANGQQPTRQAVGDALDRVCWNSHLEGILVKTTECLSGKTVKKGKP